MRMTKNNKGKEPLGVTHIGQWVKEVSEGRKGLRHGNKVRSCLSKGWCPKGGMKKTGKGTHNLSSTHTLTHTNTLEFK